MSSLKKDLIKYTPREEQQRVHEFVFKIKNENPNDLPDIKRIMISLN